jgi:Prenyltransferase and squalene oxidase repeat
MKPKKRSIVIAVVLIVFCGATAFGIYTFHTWPNRPNTAVIAASVNPPAAPAAPAQPCVFQTVFGLQPSDSNFIYKTPAKAQKAIDEALQWMAKAQGDDGGWGAGSFYAQEVIDPHAVKSDPATTAIVSMALLRCKNTPTTGMYAANLNKATNFLLLAVEAAPENADNITSLENTQPQRKLGANIDVILTSQYLTNLLDEIDNNKALKKRVKACVEKCVRKIQHAQQADGSFKGSGWAGVLQSSLANNALETAEDKDIHIDTAALEKSRSYQKGNYNASDGTVKTDMGAGVTLYAVSSSSRASAKEAKVAKEKIEEGKKSGLLKETDSVSAENLQKVGYSYSQATKYQSAYEINKAAKGRAVQNDVMDGFGSNGGEEFLSYLQTGEGMIVSKDDAWKKWYDDMSGRLLKIQNNDGSWSGHHCITSPVFCTATCLLVLSVNNDIEHLLRL